MVPYGAKNKYSMPVELTLYGRAENKAEVVRRLRSSGYYVLEGVTSIGSGGGKKSGAGGMRPSQAALGQKTYLNPASVCGPIMLNIFL